MANLFIINVIYTADMDKIESILSNHREYLKNGYDSGFLLASGPQNPRVGGMIIGKFDTLESAKKFTQKDPFYLNNVARYEIIEFSPILFNRELTNFLQ